MSDAPTQLSTIHRPLKVAVDGVFEPRLKVTQLKLGCDDRLSEATLEAYVGSVQATAYHGGLPAMSVAQFMSGAAGVGLSPDQVVLIYRDGDGDDATPQVLMRGFGDVQTYIERGSMSGSESSGSIRVFSVLGRLNALPSAQIVGRRMRTADSIDAWRDAGSSADPIGGDGDLVRVDRPCTFNARGCGNRHRAPITVTIGGEPELLYVFSDDDDPDGELWTWAQALRYLEYCHLNPAVGLIDWTNLWDQTRAYISGGVSARPTTPVGEASGFDGEPSTPSTLLKYALLGVPNDAVLQGMSFGQAMTVIAKCTDTHFTVRTRRAGGNIVDDLVWWARGGGRRREVCKNPSGDTVAEVLESLNINQMAIQADYRDVITAPIGYGDIRRHEITADLVPGWRPDANVDRPANVNAAIAASEVHINSTTPQTDAWFQKYHNCGSSFSAYANVGRRWVLNETGRYASADYARATGYYVSSKYSPWNPSACSIVERTYVNGEWTQQPAEWTRHPRPFQNCFSADAADRSLGIVVEVSFDSGVRWERIACTVLASEAGIYIDVDDLTQLVSVYDTTMHWWKAMCKDQARVRVTAVVESDRALTIVGSASKPAINHAAARFYDWSEQFKSNYRASANSIFAPGGVQATEHQTIECRDDSPLMDQWLASLSELNASRQLPGSFSIPWLECTRYRVGDCVPLIRGAVTLEGSASGGVRRPPDIVSIVYSNTSTQLILEDPNMADLGAD